jgi:hypothetical protein
MLREYINVQYAQIREKYVFRRMLRLAFFTKALSSTFSSHIFLLPLTLLSYGMQKLTSVSEKCTASTFKVKEFFDH